MKQSSNFSRRHSVSGVFVFLLLGVFAVFSTVIVLLGAQLFQNVREQTEVHNNHRVLTHYVTNAVHANDVADSVVIRNENGTDVLVFVWDPDGDAYETRIFCRDGVLYEQFCSAEDALDPAYAEVICEAQSFVPQMEDGLLAIRITDSYGAEETLYAAIHSKQ